MILEQSIGAIDQGQRYFTNDFALAWVSTESQITGSFTLTLNSRSQTVAPGFRWAGDGFVMEFEEGFIDQPLVNLPARSQTLNVEER